MRSTEDWTRHKVLPISELAEETDETDDQTLHAIQKLMGEKLAVPIVKVAKACRANKSSSSSNPQQVIAQLVSEYENFCSLKFTSKLKSISLCLQGGPERFAYRKTLIKTIPEGK